MPEMSQEQTFYGVGRLHRGHRNMGCVGYCLQNINGSTTVVRFDPMPEAAQGDVFHLTLEDGRILECQVLNEYTTYCAVLDGPRIERRHHRRPAPMTRAYL
jgi:Fe-S-cluster containining protein